MKFSKCTSRKSKIKLYVHSYVSKQYLVHFLPSTMHHIERYATICTSTKKSILHRFKFEFQNSHRRIDKPKFRFHFCNVTNPNCHHIKIWTISLLSPGLIAIVILSKNNIILQINNVIDILQNENANVCFEIIPKF